MGSPNPKKYTAEFRRETADYVISTGRLVKQMTKELGINDNMLSNQVARRRRELSGQAPASTSVEDKELREAKKRIRELKMENEFLKKRDLIRRDFTSSVPTYKLIGDTTYLKTGQGQLYLATLNNEMYYRTAFATRDEAKHAVIEFIEVYYNRKRLHLTIDYRIFADMMGTFFERLDRAIQDVEEVPMAA